MGSPGLASLPISGLWTCRDTFIAVQAVCKGWNHILTEVPLLKDVFRREWCLTRLIGEPLKPSFYLASAAELLQHGSQPLLTCQRLCPRTRLWPASCTSTRAQGETC